MRKNYKLKLFTVLVIAGVSIGGANAFNPNLTSTTIITENSDNWVEIKNENGLKISLKDEVLASVRYISIHFENNSNKEISFSWELNQGGKLIKSNDSTNRVRPNGGTLIIDSTSGIKLLSSDLITDFDVNIILK
jgi:hypothetical protein